MLVVRKEGKAHEQYNSFRSAFELLEAVGREPNDGFNELQEKGVPTVQQLEQRIDSLVQNQQRMQQQMQQQVQQQVQQQMISMQQQMISMQKQMQQQIDELKADNEKLRASVKSE